MANNSGNILIGAASMAIGVGVPTVGVESLVDSIKSAATGSPKDFRGWVNGLPRDSGSELDSSGVTFYATGFTTTGVEVNYMPDYQDAVVDQLLDAARIFKVKMSVHVKTAFSEATLPNLVYVWDMADNLFSSAGGYDEVYLAPGELGDHPQERVLAFAGQAPLVSGDSRQRLYVATRAISMQASAHALKRDGVTEFPVEFRLLPDGNSSFSAYGKIVDQST